MIIAIYFFSLNLISSKQRKLLRHIKSFTLNLYDSTQRISSEINGIFFSIIKVWYWIIMHISCDKICLWQRLSFQPDFKLGIMFHRPANTFGSLETGWTTLENCKWCHSVHGCGWVDLLKTFRCDWFRLNVMAAIWYVEAAKICEWKLMWFSYWANGVSFHTFSKPWWENAIKMQIIKNKKITSNFTMMRGIEWHNWMLCIVRGDALYFSGKKIWIAFFNFDPRTQMSFFEMRKRIDKQCELFILFIVSSSFITIICWLHCHSMATKRGNREFVCTSLQIT